MEVLGGSGLPWPAARVVAGFRFLLLLELELRLVGVGLSARSRFLASSQAVSTACIRTTLTTQRKRRPIERHMKRALHFRALLGSFGASVFASSSACAFRTFLAACIVLKRLSS